jgi:hypothetical protein
MGILRTLTNATVLYEKKMNKEARILEENEGRKKFHSTCCLSEILMGAAQNDRAPTEQKYVSIIKRLDASSLPPCTADVILSAKPFRRYLYSA